MMDTARHGADVDVVTRRREKIRREHRKISRTCHSLPTCLDRRLLLDCFLRFHALCGLYATVAEVYTLNSLLIVTILWLMFAWRRKFE
jgi:hypothetical protein